MADRTCGVYLYNDTPFQLRRIDHNVITGDWFPDGAEPPEVIQPRQISPPVAWLIKAPWGNPFRGTEGFVEYRVKDKLPGYYLSVPTSPGEATIVEGDDRVAIRLNFASPWEDAIWL